MRILVTGGNGFLGKHVQKEFNKYRNITATFPNSKQLNLLNYSETLHYLNLDECDVILHMAAICGGILANKNKPADFLTKNIQMGINVFESAKEIGIPYIYTLGSVCSFPKFCPPPFNENDIWQGYPEESNAPYGHAKRTLLMLQNTYREQYGIKGAHLIPVNMFGEHDSFDLTNSHVIPALIRKFYEAKINNKPNVKCWGTGTGATREFLYAGDAAELIVKAVVNKLDTELPINIGTGMDISIKNLAHLIAELVDYKGNIIFTGEVSDGQPKRQLDVSRAKEILGWEAKTSLKDGLKNTIDWYVKNRETILFKN